MNKLTLITGCMFAGKSTMLLKKYKECKTNNLKCILFKPNNDTRYSQTNIITHDSLLSEECINIPFNQPEIILDQIKEFNLDYIFIDEISLFEGNNLSIVIGKLLSKYNVTVSGLLYDFKKDYFSEVKKISYFANEVIYLTSKCHICGEEAKNNQRLIIKDGVEIPAKKSDPILLIGSNDFYQVRCDNCFIIG